MIVQTQHHGWTEEQLMSLPKIGHKYEIVEGRLMMAPAGGFHGSLGVRVSGAISAYVTPRKMGWVFESSTGFWMKSGNLCCPDVSFMSRGRFPGLKRPPAGFIQGAPDLAVEILSPSDTLERIHERIVEYFDNGTHLAWVISPSSESATIYRDARPSGLVTIDGTLDGGEVIAGFTLTLASIFVQWD